MKHSRIIVTIIAVLILVLIVVYCIVKIWLPNLRSKEHQANIQDFYNFSSDEIVNKAPGDLLKTEPLGVDVPGGTGYRMMYVSETPDGQTSVSSGMFFIPASTAPYGGRKVVAWSHGTLGFGDACAPSRSQEPTKDMANWLGGIMDRGWAVVATDYTGIGTAGEPYYLIGQSEAKDVLNSVRALRDFDEAQAGRSFIVWGHSQGGHASLFTAEYAATYAPELRLVADVASAPAAQLNSLFSQQYNKPTAWAIGPDVAVSWPQVYKNLDVASVLTQKAKDQYQALAAGCVMEQVAGLEVKSIFKEQFFTQNPMDVESWSSAAQEQTPDTAKINVPLYIAQGLDDTVVLPNATALLVQNACDNGTNVTSEWFGTATHLNLTSIAGPSIVSWMQERFEGIANTSTCGQPMPVDPA